MLKPISLFISISNQGSIKVFFKKNKDYEIIKNSDLDFSNYINEHDLDSYDYIKHYLKNWRVHHLLVPNYFDSTYYLENNIDVREAGINPLVHFLRYGELEGRLGFDENDSDKNEIRKKQLSSDGVIDYDVFSKEVFDVDFYLNSNTDLCEVDAYEHYMSYGRFEGWRVPAVLFNKEFIKKVTQDKLPQIEIVEKCDIIESWYQLEFDDKLHPSLSSEMLLKHFYNKKQYTKDQYVELIVSTSKLFSGCGFHSDYQLATFIVLFNPYLVSINKDDDFIDAFKSWKENGFESEFSGFFDAQYYADKVAKQFNNTLDAFHDWYTNSMNKSIVPCKTFDESYYLSANKDLSTNQNLFLHFVFYGQYEKRKVSPWFEYSDTLISELNRLSPYHFWLTFDGMEDSSSLVNIVKKKHFGQVVLNSQERLKLLSALLEVFNSQIITSLLHLKILINLLDLEEVSQQTIRTVDDFISILYDWKNSDFQAEFSPLFDNKFIKKHLTINSKSQLEIFDFWFHELFPQKISCTPLFTEEFYLDSNLDLASYPHPLIQHYILHGAREGRKAHPVFDPKWIENTYDCEDFSGIDFYFKSERKGIPLKPSPAHVGLNNVFFNSKNGGLNLKLKDLVRLYHEVNIFDLSEKSSLIDMIRKAPEIDPQIKVKNPTRQYTVMPFNVDTYPYTAGLESLIGKTDILIFRDNINFGGADAVLSEVYKVYKSLPNSPTVKIIVTGEADSGVYDKFGLLKNDIVELDGLLQRITDPVMFEFIYKEILYDIIIGSEAKQVVNLNCRHLWNCYESYGKILNQFTQLSAFLFCDDRDGLGNVAGYPSRYLLSTWQYLDRILFDSYYLKDVVEQRMLLPQSLEEKISVLSTPVDKPKSQYLYNGVCHHAKIETIAWAGRFDSQKRPDLLKDIALALPDIKFKVWGKSVLSKNGEKIFEGVKNIQLMGTYKNIDELVHEGCDLYLYTSEWDGVPTILLKVMEMGMPIVASSVGGVPEILPTECLVTEVEAVDDYVNAIHSLNKDLSLSTEKLQNEYRKTLLMRSFESFKQTLIGEDKNNG